MQTIEQLLQSVLSPRPRAIDMFCGIGGNSQGGHEANLEIVAGFDKWPLALKVYQNNFPRAQTFEAALENLNPTEVHEQIGKVDFILASPECTSHSIARGNRVRETLSMDLAFQVTRFARVFQPRWILIENVVQMQNWNRYPEFINELQEGLGYHLREQQLVASDFGVPQSRLRLFILCDREATPPEIAPSPDIVLKNAEDIIGIGGPYRTTLLDNGRRAARTLARAQMGIAAQGDQPFLLVYYGSGNTTNGGWQRLDVPLRTVTTLDRFALVTPGENGHVMRMLQVPELQEAMGFPRNYQLNHGTRRNKIHMLGNAVCPPLITKIVKTMLNNPPPQKIEPPMSVYESSREIMIAGIE